LPSETTEEEGLGKNYLSNVSLLKALSVFFIYLHVKSDFPRAVNFWERNDFKGKTPLLWMYKEI